MFRPTSPQDRRQTEMERKEWEKEQQEKKERKRLEDRRFWITTAVSAAAALAGVGGIVLQLVLRQ